MSGEHSSVEYREIPNYPGYRVGSDGSLWSRRAKVFWPNGVRGTAAILGDTWKQMKTTPSRKTSYCLVQLSQNNKIVARLMQRLVLEAFVGPCPIGMEACHNDGDRTNNAISNLRWDTKKANQGDRRKHGTHHQGEQMAAAKLTEEVVSEMRRLHAAGVSSATTLAKRYGVSKSAAKQAIGRKTWRHVP